VHVALVGPWYPRKRSPTLMVQPCSNSATALNSLLLGSITQLKELNRVASQQSPLANEAMSLGELSTELDSNIAAHLVGDTQTLSAFSKVSKYYRNIVESYLYHVITFHDLDTYYIRCLLVTILDCPSVGLHIRRFNIGHDSHMRREADMDAESVLRKKLWDKANQIRDRIDQVMRLFPEEIQSIVGTEAVDFCHQWAGSCYKSSSADPVAALIICVAQISISSHSVEEDRTCTPQCVSF